MNLPKYKIENIDRDCHLSVNGGNVVPPVLKEVSKLAAGVAAVATGSATGNPRNKCALQPGHSLMDWIRLGASGKDLTGVGDKAGTLVISPRELASHCTENDAWIAIRGRVYNVTHYLPFHPGGVDELMRGAGKDATQLFNEVHAWVNYESILQKCLIGRLSALDPDIDTEELFYGTKPKSKVPTAQKTLFPTPNLTDTNTISKNLPRFDWIQKSDSINVIFYTKSFSNPQIQISSPSKTNEVIINLIFGGKNYENKIKFLYNIHWPCKIISNCETGKVEIIFRKIESKIWENFGILEQNVGDYGDISSKRIKYVVLNKYEVNYNSCILSLQRIDGHRQTVPIGQHLRVFGNVNGEDISRSYTPIPSIFVPKTDPDVIQGDICLLIKGYPDGILSPKITSSKKGDTLELSSPLGPFDLRCIESKEAFLMVAAGTGITPMLGLLMFVLERRNRKCQKATLLFFNKKEDDILLREQLDKLEKSDERLEIQHILSEPDNSWTGSKGQISDSIIKSAIGRQCAKTQFFPADIYVTICGPTQFTSIAEKMFQEMGYQNQHMHCFLG